MTLLGAILVGGQSMRMGEDKAGVIVGGETMLSRVNNALEEVVDEVVLLGSPRAGFVNWPDVTKVKGPLAGIVSALDRSDHARVLVVAVDNAFVRIATLQHIAGVESTMPVVPVDEDGVRQVTCAVYPTSIAPQAREEADGGGSIQSLLDRVSFEPVTPETWRSWGEDGRSWFSLDTPQRVEEGVVRFMGASGQSHGGVGLAD